MAAKATSTQLSVDDDLGAAWKQVIDECDRTAGWSKQDKRILTVSDVINNINPHKEIQPTTTTNAKKFIKTTLVCIQRFGDVVATATTAVFPPSQQCFNAVNFVIIATQKTGEFFADVTTLMERVSVFLESLSVYLDDETIKVNLDPNKHAKTMLDERLRPRVYYVLQHFITIMTLTHELATRKKREITTVFVKNLFLGKDDRMKDALATLETRIADITRIQVTVIGQDLKGAARDIREMKADMDLMLSTDQENTKLLKSLKDSEDERRVLEVERLNDKSIRLKFSLDGKQLWRDRHIRISEERVSGTGSWLVERHTGFTDWADIKNDIVPPVFALSAPGGYGKTFLTHAVVEHLLGKYRRDDLGRCVELAYYYLPNVSQKMENDAQGGSQINKAIKAIVYQLYQNNAAYREFIGSACEEDINFGNTGEIWTKLVLEYTNANEVNIFVLIDGIKAMGTQESHLLSAIASLVSTSEGTKSSVRLRVFITGRPDAIMDSQKRCGLSEPQIRLGEETANADRLANEDDIRQVLQARLKSMQNFWREGSSTKQKHKTRIQEVLLQHVGGDYDRHDLVLREVEHCINVKQLDVVLSQVNESQKEKIERQIEILNSTLSQDEIIELNAIASWLHDSHGSEWTDQQKSHYHFSTRLPVSSERHPGMHKAGNLSFKKLPRRTNSPQLSLLEEYLALTMGNERFVTLQQQINDRYSVLLEIREDNLVIWKYDQLKSIGLETSESIADQMARRRRVAFPPEELALIQKIVKTQFANVFGRDGDVLYDKYGLDDFFGSITDGRGVRVKLDLGASHASILNACLIAICDQHDATRTPNLRGYAYQNFKHHLEKASPQQVDVLTALNIGRNIVKLMREEAYVDLWWSHQHHTEFTVVPKFWKLFEDSFPDIIRRWLSHPAVLEKFEEVPLVKDWLSELSAPQAPATVLMRKVTEIAAKRWYSGEVSDWFSPYEFVFEYVQYSKPPKLGSSRRPYVPIGDKLRDVKDVEDWIKTECAIDIDDLLLLSLRVGQMFFELSTDDKYHLVQQEGAKYEKAALERCEAALSRRPNHWRATTLKAQIDMKHDQYETVLQHLNSVMSGIQENVSARKSIPTDDWRLGYKLLSRCYFKVGSHNMAVESFLQAISLGVDNYEYHRISAWFPEALELLDSPDDDRYVMQLVQFLDDFQTPVGMNLRSILAYELQSRHHRIIMGATRRTGALQKIAEIYRKAMAEAFESTMSLDDYDLKHLRKFKVEYGRLLLYVGTSSEREDALALFQQNVSEEDDKIELAEWLLSQVRTIGYDSHKSADYISRVQRLTDMLHYCNQSRDTRLRLARVHHLCGDAESARSVLYGVLDSCHQYRSRGPDLRFRFGPTLAYAYTILDRHEDAITAWQLVGPIFHGNSAIDFTEYVDSDWEKMYKKDEIFYCADGCGDFRAWAYDMYVCKDCIDVSLMPTCYEKLHQGLLDPDICGKDHQHLYISPPVDEAIWKAMNVARAEDITAAAKKGEFLHILPMDEATLKELKALHAEDSMKVGDAVVPIERWTKQRMQEWGLQE